LPGVVAGAAGRWNLRVYRECGFSSCELADAVRVIQEGRGLTAKGAAYAINHWDPESGLCEPENLLFGDKVPFPGDMPGVAEDGLVLLAKTLVWVPEAGDYTFGVQSDDSFGLRVEGGQFVSATGNGGIDRADAEVLYWSEGTCNSNTRGVYHFDAAGQYEVELVYYECSGNAYIELYWAKGAFQNNSDTTAWKLVGLALPPRLECRFEVSGQGGQLRMEWEAGMSGWILERTGSLTPPITWVPVGGVTGNTATVPLSEAAGFYRLRQ
jgi:hypothetical protein